MLFVATFIRSAFGFGEALIAVPLLALLMPIDVAAPLAVLVSITVAVVTLVQDWALVRWRSAGRLLGATLIGSPVGLLILTRTPEAVVKGFLGAVIVIFSTSFFVRRSSLHLTDDRFAWGFGLAAGVLGGAYGMQGPPLVMFATLRRWPAGQFRATLQGYFLPASLLTLLGYWAADLLSVTVTRHYLFALPVTAVAILLGRLANRRLEGPAFLRYVHGGLIGVGTVLLIQAFSSA